MKKTNEKKKTNTKVATLTKLNSGMNTAKVKVERQMRHAMYEKLIKSHKNYLVEIAEADKANYAVGDKVVIEETTPKSKRKSWKLVSKFEIK